MRYVANSFTINQLIISTGEVPEVRLLTNKVKDDGKWQAKSKGAAFLEWNTVDALQKALKYHHTHLGKRSINVELSAGGGGKSQNRMQKISARNKDLGGPAGRLINPMMTSQDV